MCALPKGFRNNIRLVNPKVGYERRQELVDFLSEKNTFLPQGVHYKDMDTTFIEFVKQDLKIEIDGKEVPVIFLTIQRYSEFTKTWKFTDEYKNISLPFVTIVRKPDVQVGTNYAGLYNIPGKPLFTYYKVPTNDGARTGVDLYKVPQPTSVDITYEVRLFTNKMNDLNLFNEKVQRLFNARQYYIWPKAHPMPLTLESIGDESNIDDFENRRFFVQPFEIKLAGYILDENDFEVQPSINRAMVMSEISEDPAKARVKEKNVNTRGPIVQTTGNVRITNTLNNFIATVTCNQTYTVADSVISNSGNTYSISVPATTNFILPDATVLRDGIPFGTVAIDDSIDVPSAGSDLVIMGDLIETLYPSSPIDFNFTVNGVPQSVGYDVGTQTIQASAPDATILINGTQFDDAPSGAPTDIPVVNGGSNPVGSEQSGEWVIGNSTVFINGTQVGDIVAEDSLPIAVELDGNPSGTWNAGTQTWEVTSNVPYPFGWQRNPDWLTMPTPSPEEFYALFLVFEGKDNIAAIQVNVGGGTIDWGDGSTDAPTGSAQFHEYDYASLAGPIYADPWGYGNYKQVMVSVTGGTITDIRLDGATIVQGWADIAADMPSCAAVRIATNSTSYAKLLIHLERVVINDLAAGGGVPNLLRSVPNVGSLHLPWAKIGNDDDLLLSAGREIVLPAITVNNVQTGMFQASGLLSIESLTILSGANIRIFENSSLRRIDFVTFPASTTSLRELFDGTSSLASQVTINAPSVTDIQSIAINSTLPKLTITDASGVTNTSNSFNGANVCDGVILNGITVGFSVANTNLTTAGASASFTALGTAAGAQNITVTGTPFGIAFAALDAAAVAAAAIATGKGFTIVN